MLSLRNLGPAVVVSYISIHTLKTALKHSDSKPPKEYEKGQYSRSAILNYRECQIFLWNKSDILLQQLAAILEDDSITEEEGDDPELAIWMGMKKLGIINNISVSATVSV